MTLIRWIQFIYGQAHVKPVLQYQLLLIIYPFSILFATLATEFLVKTTFSFYSNIYIPLHKYTNLLQCAPHHLFLSHKFALLYYHNDNIA